MTRLTREFATVLGLAVLTGYSCGNFRDTGGRPVENGLSVDSARGQILAKFMGTLEGKPLCVAIDRTIMREVAPLSVDDIALVMSDLAKATSDPEPSSPTEALGSRVVPWSRCPQREMNPDWYHLRAGPIRITRPEQAEMVVAVSLDGFPEYYLCKATLDAARRPVAECTHVASA